MSRLLLLAALLSLVGCNSTARRCENVCTEFMTTCGWTAWPSVEACKAGCEDDLYRRSDAAEVLDCYDAAVAPMPEDAAEDLITRAITEGIFEADEADGSFSYIAEVDRFVEASRCDVFATVQCKVQAVQQPINTPLLP
jgi:hypothetical protein